MRLSTQLCAALLGSALAGSVAAGAAAPETPDARALFVANCATCHGATGDGRGATVLDRPARSFQDGGFSFGNTPEALFRTITTGIPGTPMPGFAGALSDDERRAVAAYVRTLGPPVDDTQSSDAELVVGERPLIVRGMLPPIADGAPAHPRGLLIGTPSGLTFEYRADDVALLGVRQGRFVNRTDWVGRGGTGLEPLGKVVYAHEGGVPRSAFEIATGEPDGWAPLHAQLVRTVAGMPAPPRAPGNHPALRPETGVWYRLFDGDGHAVAEVEETLHAIAGTIASGFRREFRVRHLQQASRLRMRMLTPGTLPHVTPFTTHRDPPSTTQWHAARRAGFVECVGAEGARDAFRPSPPVVVKSPAGVVHVHLEPRGMPDAGFRVTTLLLPDWSEDTQAALEAEYDAR